MKSTQVIQNRYLATGKRQTKQPLDQLKRIAAFFRAMLPFTNNKEMDLLRHELQYKQQEIAQLKWDLMQKNEMVKNIAFHQSHNVRRPLANILGVIELMNANKNELPEADLHELFSLLKISADTLDRAIKHNSTAGQL